MRQEQVPKGSETSCHTRSERITMTSNISGRTAKKAMRVATVFTGAAASAAIFAPTANAQPAGTRIGTCANGHYFHVSHIYSTCYGGVGYAYPDIEYAHGFCGGNNSGFFSGITREGIGKFLSDQRFGPGSTFYNFANARKYSYSSFDMTVLYLSGWYGSGTQDKSCQIP
jgi:hypothetical protein